MSRPLTDTFMHFLSGLVILGSGLGILLKDGHSDLAVALIAAGVAEITGNAALLNLNRGQD
jgi:hypothetical protein